MEKVYVTWRRPGTFRTVQQAPAIVVKRHQKSVSVRVYHPSEGCYQFLNVKAGRLMPREESIEEADRA